MRAICSMSSTMLTAANFFSPHSTPRNAEYTPEKTSAGSIIMTSVMDSRSANSAPIGFLKIRTSAHKSRDIISSSIKAAEQTPPLERPSFAVILDTTSGIPEVMRVRTAKKKDSATEYTPIPTAPISRDRYILNINPSVRSATVNAVNVTTAFAIGFMGIFYV